ncbi:MAG: 2-hydroxyacyl-CoA dehydratase [Lachnospiraceae bacterium]|nr:2-hydroxyacyl-CoA dehydratase [Lachnospiraceae bacterium]
MRLLALSGFVPEAVCDVERFVHFSGDRNIAHYCGYANDYISQVITDPGIDGAVFPKSCDSSRIIGSYLDSCGKFIYQIPVPPRRDRAAVLYLAEELQRYHQSLEEYYECRLQDIPDRMERIWQRNRMIGEAYDRLESISYTDYLQAIHSCLKKPLSEQKFQVSSECNMGLKKRVFLVGSFLSNERIPAAVESVGLKIVGDDLPESGRLRNQMYPERDTVYASIAEGMLLNRLSPTQSDFERMIDRDLHEIHKSGVDAVIFITQKYCEPYDYLYYIFRKKLEAQKIPALKISVTNSEDSGKLELILDAFADTL